MALYLKTGIVLLISFLICLITVGDAVENQLDNAGDGLRVKKYFVKKFKPNYLRFRKAGNEDFSNFAAAASRKLPEDMGTTSTVVDLLGSCVLMTLAFYLGTAGYSMVWIGLCTGFIFVRELLWRKRQKHQLSLRQAALREKEIILRSIRGELPAWVQFPEMEKVEWINKVIRQAWPYIGIYMQSFIRDFIEPQIKACMPGPFKSFQFEMIDMGDIPLRVGGLKVQTENVGKDQIIMDMDVLYAGDCNIVVKVGGAFKGGLRHMKVIDFELTGMGEIGELPGLIGAIKSITTDQVRSICVLPNVIVVPFSEDTDVTRLLFPEPDGVVRIHIVEARNLENRDVIGESDPYVTFTVGAQQFKTSVIDDDLNPVWNEFFEAVVDQASGQQIQMEVFDEDKASKDEELGILDLEISTIREKGMVDAWYPLEAAKHGDLHLVLYWMALTPYPEDLVETRKEAEWLKRWEEVANVDTKSILHPAVLMVYVDNVIDLPSLKRGRDPCPLVRLTVGDKVEDTFPKLNTRCPVYQQKFNFFVRDPEIQLLYIEARDDGMGQKSLGEAAIPLKTLLREDHMEIYQKTWHLALESHTSTITMTLRLRSLRGARIRDVRNQTSKEGTRKVTKLQGIPLTKLINQASPPPDAS